MGLNQSPFRVLFRLGFAINKNNESSSSLQFCAQHILIRVRKRDRQEKKPEKIKRKKRGEKNLQLIHNLVSVLFRLLLDLPKATSPLIRIGQLLFKQPFDATHEAKTNNHEQGGERGKKRRQSRFKNQTFCQQKPKLQNAKLPLQKSWTKGLMIPGGSYGLIASF